MTTYELAQLNIGIIRGPMDSPVMAEFAANLARINALAESSPGFIWRLQTEDGGVTYGNPAIRRRAHAREHVGLAGCRVIAWLCLPIGARRNHAPTTGMVRAHGSGLPGALVGAPGTSTQGA